MNVSFKFFDNHQWSIFATLRAFIILCIFAFSGHFFKFHMLILASLLAMMDGFFVHRIIFATFMSLLFYEKSMEYIKKLFFIIIAVIASGFVYENGFLHQFLIKRLSTVVYFLIGFWFLYIFFRMIY